MVLLLVEVEVRLGFNCFTPQHKGKEDKGEDKNEEEEEEEEDFLRKLHPKKIFFKKISEC